MSRKITSKPAAAATWAIPRPIVPAPSTAIVLIKGEEDKPFSSEFALKCFRHVESNNRWNLSGFGACLVRLTRTLLFILYAQSKTPTDFPKPSYQPEVSVTGPMSRNLNWAQVPNRGVVRSGF